MPKFKDVEFVAKNDAGAVDKFKVSVEISATGSFYTHVPDKLRPSFPEDRIAYRGRGRAGFFTTVGMATFDELVKTVKKAHDDLMKPTVTEEPVIRYNIESHVSFAVTKDGRIFPNAGYPGAEWPNDKMNKYGDHHSANAAEDGYSLVVGAKAMIKKTTTYGENSTVKYEYYYKDGDHYGQDNPAEKLNSWASFSLPADAKEMPYSDEAAMFFHGLMMAMAELNRRIQEFTSTPETLALAIQRHSNLLLLEGPAQVAKPGKKASGTP